MDRKKTTTAPHHPPPPQQTSAVMSQGKVQDCIVVRASEDDDDNAPATEDDNDCLLTSTKAIKAEPKDGDVTITGFSAIPRRFATQGHTVQAGILIDDSDEETTAPSSSQKTGSRRPISQLAPSAPKASSIKPRTQVEDLQQLKKLSIHAPVSATSHNHTTPSSLSHHNVLKQTPTGANDGPPCPPKKRAAGSTSPSLNEPKPKRMATTKAIQGNKDQEQRPSSSAGSPSARGITSRDLDSGQAAAKIVSSSAKQGPTSPHRANEAARGAGTPSSDPREKAKDLDRHLHKKELSRLKIPSPLEADTAKKQSLPTPDEDVPMFSAPEAQKQIHKKRLLQTDAFWANTDIDDMTTIREDLVTLTREMARFVIVLRPFRHLSKSQIERLRKVTSKLEGPTVNSLGKVYEAVVAVQAEVKVILQEVHDDLVASKEENEGLQSRCEMLHTQVQQVRSQAIAKEVTMLQEHDTKIKELVSSLRKEIDDLTDANQLLIARKLDNENTITQLRANQHVHAQVNAANVSTITMLRGDLRTMTIKLEAQAKGLEEHKASSEAEKQKLLVGTQELATQVEGLKKTKADLTKTINSQRGTAGHMKGRYTALEQQLDGMKAQLNRSDMELDQAKEDRRATIANAIVGLQQFKSQHAEAIQEQERKNQEKIQEMEREILSLRNANADLEGKLAARADAGDSQAGPGPENDLPTLPVLNGILDFCRKGENMFAPPATPQTPPAMRMALDATRNTPRPAPIAQMYPASPLPPIRDLPDPAATPHRLAAELQVQLTGPTGSPRPLVTATDLGMPPPPLPQSRPQSSSPESRMASLSLSVQGPQST